MVQRHRRISCPCLLFFSVMLLALLPLSASANDAQTLLNSAQAAYPGGIEFAEAWLAENGDTMRNYDRATMAIYLAQCYDKSGQPEEAKTGEGENPLSAFWDEVTE